MSALQAAIPRRTFPELVMPPHRAMREMVRNHVDYLPLDDLDWRIATTLWVVYPHGIATVLPGERLVEKARPMIEYLKIFEEAANLLPGFGNEVQGVYREVAIDGTVRFHTYAVHE